MALLCVTCRATTDRNCPCPPPADGAKYRAVCERIDCDEWGCGKGVYALGYIATVCQQHYDEASTEDKRAAIRFRYAEG